MAANQAICQAKLRVGLSLCPTRLAQNPNKSIIITASFVTELFTADIEVMSGSFNANGSADRCLLKRATQIQQPESRMLDHIPLHGWLPKPRYKFRGCDVGCYNTTSVHIDPFTYFDSMTKQSDVDFKLLW